MSDELRRRAAEWRDIEFNLDRIHEHVKAKLGEKWPDEEDIKTLNFLKDCLKNVLCNARMRLQDTLRQQIIESIELDTNVTAPEEIEF